MRNFNPRDYHTPHRWRMEECSGNGQGDLCWWREMMMMIYMEVYKEKINPIV